MSIGQHGIEVKTREKDNVMTVGLQLAFILTFGAIVLLLFSHTLWVTILGAVVFVVTVVVLLSVYISHNIKNPELLQSEKYRLEKQRIEMGMLEAKQNYFINTQQPTNLIETNPKNETTYTIVTEPENEETL